MPPPPPYYYRPVYGNGYHPNNNYNRPTQYNKVLSDNNVVVVNNNNRNNSYWGGYDDRPTGKPRAKQVNSPISSGEIEPARTGAVERAGEVAARGAAADAVDRGEAGLEGADRLRGGEPGSTRKGKAAAAVQGHHVEDRGQRRIRTYEGVSAAGQP